MTKPRIFVQAGQRFGQLVVTDPETRIYTPSSPRGDRAATCRCDCGNEVTVRLSKLAGRNPPKATRACGRHDPHHPGRRTHGLKITRSTASTRT